MSKKIKHIPPGIEEETVNYNPNCNCSICKLISKCETDYRVKTEKPEEYSERPEWDWLKK